MFLEILQAATRIGIHRIIFCGVIFLLQNRAIVHRTLLNAITDVFMRMFWNSYTENFGKYPEKRI